MAGILGGMGVGDTQLFTERFENHPSPQPSPKWGEGEREPIFKLFKPEFDSISPVEKYLENTSVSPLASRGGPTFREG